VAETIGSLLVAAIGAGIGWAVTEFVARPVRRFFDLRTEIIQTMAQYANLRARHKEMQGGPMQEVSPTEMSALEEARTAVRGLGARMRSFAYGETLAASVVSLRYDPRKASEGLFGYSNVIDTYGPEKASKKKMIENALRLPEHLL
jgi:hypothetical protein